MEKNSDGGKRSRGEKELTGNTVNGGCRMYEKQLESGKTVNGETE